MSLPLRVGSDCSLSIILVGITHREAPIEIREQITLTETEQRNLLSGLTRDGIYEAVVVSTCNRLELYAVASESDHVISQVTSMVASRSGVETELVYKLIRVETDCDAIQHLERVASGLESMVLGEPHILGQVSDSIAIARSAGTAGTILTRLFDTALRAGKRARRETGVGNHTSSVAQVGVALASQQLGGFDDLDAVVVGAGQMSIAAVQALQARGLRRITLVNRTFDRASRMASRFGVKSKLWGQLGEALSNADLVISATSSSLPVIGLPVVSAAMENRPQRSLLLVDIAVPRDIDPSVRDVPGISILNIDDFSGVRVEAHDLYESQAASVEAIVREELESFVAWLHIREAVPAISKMRRRVVDIGQTELERAIGRLSDLELRERDVIERMVHSIVQKVLHGPTIGLRNHVVKANRQEYPWYSDELQALGLSSVNDKG